MREAAVCEWWIWPCLGSAYRMRSHEIVCGSGLRDECQSCKDVAGLELAGDQFRDTRQQSFVLVSKRVFEIAIDVYLSKNIGAAPDEHHDL